MEENKGNTIKDDAVSFWNLYRYWSLRGNLQQFTWAFRLEQIEILGNTILFSFHEFLIKYRLFRLLNTRPHAME